MSTIPDDKLYDESHEWILIEGDIATVGITDHAQDQLGDLVYVELPEVDATISKGDACSVVESVKAASDVYAPIDGVIVEVNEDLVDAPETINESPYDAGWLFKVRLTGGTEHLMDAAAYKAFIDV